MSQAPTTPSQNPYGITLYTVQTPTGSDINLQTNEEADWYEDRRDRYLNDNQFPNVSDLQDLDRILLFEIMVFRWSTWLTQGFDYMHARIDESALKTNIKEYSTELRLLKQSLGIDKATRDKEKGESLADYTAHLLQRAKEFGYHRNEQYEIVVTKFYEMCAMIKTFDRCDDEERALLDLSEASILEWIRQKVIQPFDEHADAFRKNQAIWVREM
jgi:hypothetical protein